MNQIGMKEAWKLADGNGVIVAVLDTGVAYGNHDKFHLLEDLVTAERSEFLFIALPLKIAGATGSMLRPVAVL